MTNLAPNLDPCTPVVLNEDEYVRDYQAFQAELAAMPPDSPHRQLVAAHEAAKAIREARSGAIEALPPDAPFHGVVRAVHDCDEAWGILREAERALRLALGWPLVECAAWADAAYDVDGEADELSGLGRDGNICFHLSGTVYRSGLTGDARAYQRARRSNRRLPELEPRQLARAPDEAHRWALFEDVGERGRLPESFGVHFPVWSGDVPLAIRAWVEQWRESHRALQGREMVVAVRPGRSTIFALWFDEPQMMAGVRRFAREHLNPTGALEPRFLPAPDPCDLSCVVIERTKTDYGATEQETELGTACVYLPAEETASNVVTLADRKAKAAPAGSGPVLRTRLAALDRQFREGVEGLPLGALVVVGGQAGNCKTTLAVHLAEEAREGGWFVVWLAIDEQVELVEQRLKQRRGAALNPEAFFVVGQDGDHYETLAEQAHREANGRPVLIVVDSLQRLLTRAGEGKGERERITAAVEAIAKCQERFPSVVVATTEIARGSGEAKGSGSIDYLATLALRLARTGAKLNVRVTKNRHGGEQPFALAVDFERQRLLEAGASPAKAEAGTLRARILAAAVELGDDASGRGVTGRVTGKAATIRAELAAMVVDGVLRLEAGVYRRP